MTAPSPQTTITSLRGRVSQLIDARDKLKAERDDARDEVVQLCQERLQLQQQLAAAAEEIRRQTETTEAAKRGWAKASTEVERLTAEHALHQAALDRVLALREHYRASDDVADGDLRAAEIDAALGSGT